MRKGFTLVEIMIVVAIVALLAAIAIPNLLRARVTSSEAYAQATLRTVSTACEEFASANAGNYPTSWTVLTNATPPYINEDYSDAIRHGYDFDCTWGASGSGYSCTADPTGSIGDARNFTITTGGVLTST